MKISLKTIPLLAAALALWPVVSQAAPPVQGDLVLGFQAEGGLGSNINVFVNLGSATTLRDTPNGGTLASIDAALDAAYGSDWFTRTDLFFGVIANFNNAPSSGPGAGAAANGDPSSTVYVSERTAAPGGSTLRSGLTPSQLTTAATTHKGQIDMLSTVTFTGAVGQVTSADPVKFANGWTAYNPFISAGVQGAGFTVFGGGIQNTFGQFGSIVFLDIQRIVPTNTGASPTVPTPGTGVVIATVAITSTGDVVAASDFHTLTLTNTAGGTVSGATTGQVFGDGAALNLDPQADVGFVFTGWTGDFAPGAANDDPLAVTMTVDRTLHAVFSADTGDTDGDGISNHDELNVHLTNPAVANTTPALPGDMNFLGTLGGLAGAEISAFDPASKRLFVTSGAGLQVLDLTNPAAPVLVSTINLSVAPFNAVSNDVSSVAVFNGKVAASVLNANKEVAGSVVFLNAATAAPGAGHLSTVTAGMNPDHVVFTPDGSKLLVANEGEYLNSNGGPGVTPGSVSIIDVTTNGFGAPIVNTVGFASFDAQVAALKTSGVRIFGAELPSNDLEPEYIAVSPDGATAMVSLQENNAVAILDIASATFTSIIPLGLKDFSQKLADFTDRDGPGATAISQLNTGNPVFGLYMPDAIAAYQQGGNTYYVMANEGDDRDDFLAPDETARVSSLTLDGGTFPNAAAQQNNAVLGRLTVTTKGANGDDLASPVTQLLSLGGRSFTIRDITGAIVYDSGGLIETTVASYGKNDGPVSGTNLVSDPISDDTRSDNKAAEPEGVAVATINGHIYAFVTLERANGVMVFDITDTNNVSVKAFLRGVDDLSPEGVIVVPAVQSPNQQALVIVSNEVSNTISVFSFDQDTTTDSNGNGFTDFQEQQLDALLKRYNIGDTVNIDLSFLTTTGTQKLAVTGLPAGLTFSPTTKRITGTITGLLGEGLVEIRVMQGLAIVRRIPFNMSVLPYRFLGNYVALLENTDPTPLPTGMVKVVVTTPNAFSATLTLQGQSNRTMKGTFTGDPGSSIRNIAMTFPAGKFSVPASPVVLPATTVNMVINATDTSDLVSGNRDTNVNTLRGFRTSKPGRRPEVTRRLTVALNPQFDGDGINLPAGTGTLAGTVDTAGVIRVTGFTGDAQALSLAMDLSQTNQCVLYVQPYRLKTSFLGGIITIGDLGLPSRSNPSSLPLADGLKWFKTADTLEKAYPGGIALQTINPATSRWIQPNSAVDLAQSLGLQFNEINVSYLNPLAVANLPTLFRLTNGYALLRLTPANSVPWTGSASRLAPPSVVRTGAFAGTLTFPAPIGAGGVSGVFLQDQTFGTLVGTGLARIPLAPAPGLLKGSFRTIEMNLNQ
jgi:hypothetical protein